MATLKYFIIESLCQCATWVSKMIMIGLHVPHSIHKLGSMTLIRVQAGDDTSTEPLGYKQPTTKHKRVNQKVLTVTSANQMVGGMGG